MTVSFSGNKMKEESIDSLAELIARFLQVKTGKSVDKIDAVLISLINTAKNVDKVDVEVEDNIEVAEDLINVLENKIRKVGSEVLKAEVG